MVFFTDALGFKIGFKFEDEGVLDFAVLRHGDLMLYLHYEVTGEGEPPPLDLNANDFLACLGQPSRSAGRSL